MVKLLVGKGANVHAVTDDFSARGEEVPCTPLDYARVRGHKEIAKYLESLEKKGPKP